MRGFPKYLSSKQDYYNMVHDRLDNKEIIRRLQTLLATALRQEAVWPAGYDPAHPEMSDHVQPIDWQTVADPNGTIFLLGFSEAEVQDLIQEVQDE